MKSTAYIIINNKPTLPKFRYWGSTGKDWVGSLKEAKFYATLKNAERAISDHQVSYKKTPSWTDNTIWEVEITPTKIEGVYKDGQKLGG